MSVNPMSVAGLGWLAILRELIEEARIARAAVRDYEQLLGCGVPADKAVDDVFISHYAVREPYVPDVEPTSSRPVWPVLSGARISGALSSGA